MFLSTSLSFSHVFLILIKYVLSVLVGGEPNLGGVVRDALILVFGFVLSCWFVCVFLFCLSHLLRVRQRNYYRCRRRTKDAVDESKETADRVGRYQAD